MSAAMNLRTDFKLLIGGELVDGEESPPGTSPLPRLQSLDVINPATGIAAHQCIEAADVREGAAMYQADIDDINRKLAILAAKYGFAATARKAPGKDSRVVFDAFCWRGAEVLNHTALYSDAELAHQGPVAIATRFVEEARSKLAPKAAD